jgi:hypothetical protein
VEPSTLVESDSTAVRRFVSRDGLLMSVAACRSNTTACRAVVLESGGVHGEPACGIRCLRQALFNSFLDILRLVLACQLLNLNGGE